MDIYLFVSGWRFVCLAVDGNLFLHQWMEICFCVCRWKFVFGLIMEIFSVDGDLYFLSVVGDLFERLWIELFLFVVAGLFLCS